MIKWMASIFVTLFIWVAGIFLFSHLKEDIPNQVTASSNLVAQLTETDKPNPSPKDLKEVIHDTQKLVMKLELEDGSLGSGFLYNQKGDIITNAHVVANAKEVKVKTTDSKEYTGQVIGMSTEVDVAVVRVKGLEEVEPLSIARIRKAEIGDEVLALGSPLGFQNTVTTGIISGLDRDLNIDNFKYEDVYQISAPIAPGNSGGPLIDRKTGEVIGINSAVSNQGMIGFSIPIRDVLPLIEAWSETPMKSLPYLNSQVEQSVTGGNETVEDYAQYIITYFYESIQLGDYVTAYSLFGSEWQSNTSYNDFRKGYLNTETVYLEDVKITKEDTNQITAVAKIVAEEREKKSKVKVNYEVTYTLGYENDQLKILSGKGQAAN
ncbi:S1C family serine protease [Mesobacillus maritimus]|uniref:S1C family serine protease n=1 Tax=Mesobacillus maritimus TaxID=1643336 RepID=UPI00203E217C|nr:trypsin-like peptidase domain-containing protein [Mesobacillus maritimus]MCM3584352.1 S1C family serine protease [Mesobacillus maritimus]MCM3669230.1 S1C family serine protease [Mesobacillus maritimus]